MSLEWGREEGISRVCLSDQADLSIAVELKPALLQLLSPRPRVLSIDLSATTELHISVIQLIWAAAREAHRHEVGFELHLPEDKRIRDSLLEIGVTLPSSCVPQIVQEPAA